METLVDDSAPAGIAAATYEQVMPMLLEPCWPEDVTGGMISLRNHFRTRYLAAYSYLLDHDDSWANGNSG